MSRDRHHNIRWAQSVATARFALHRTFAPMTSDGSAGVASGRLPEASGPELAATSQGAIAIVDDLGQFPIRIATIECTMVF